MSLTLTCVLVNFAHWVINEDQARHPKARSTSLVLAARGHRSVPWFGDRIYF
jgi:hypothetical protein